MGPETALLDADAVGTDIHGHTSCIALKETATEPRV